VRNPGAERALRAAAEASVVALAIAGDAAAFDELVRRRQGFVRALLRRLCRDAALADDLAQQAFLQAWKSIAQLRSPGAFPGWLRKLAVNGWLQHLRARGPRLESLDEAQLEEHSAPVPVAEQLDLDAALMKLAPPVRLCVVLAYHEGMSHSEISAIASLPLGTVKSHVMRGASQLRETLKDYR
jgi:RNA polymerase sigma-70 factor (ECF subfamily)